MTEETQVHRRTRKQRIVLVALFYLRDITGPTLPVWSHDLHVWLYKQDKRFGITQPALLALLNRLERQGLVAPLWEQLTRSAARPPRKYYDLTDAGVDEAIEALQELRGDRRRPEWIPIPERSLTNRPPVLPDFEVTPPQGQLVAREDAPNLQALE